MSDVFKDLCCEYADDLKFFDPDTGQTIIIIDKQYFKDLFLRAKDMNFCCTHASLLSGVYHLVRFEKATKDKEDTADWWKYES